MDYFLHLLLFIREVQNLSSRKHVCTYMYLNQMISCNPLALNLLTFLYNCDTMSLLRGAILKAFVEFGHEIFFIRREILFAHGTQNLI